MADKNYISALNVGGSDYVIKDAELRLSASQMSSAVALSVSNICSDISTLAGRMDTAETDIDTLKGNVEGLKAISAEHRADITALSSEVFTGENSLTARMMSAETDIDTLFELVKGGVHYRGKTKDANEISDGSEKNPITMTDGEELSAIAGDMVTQASKVSGKPDEEYIYDGGKWQKLGDVSEFGELAFVNKTSAAYTPEGTIGISAKESVTVDANFTKAEFAGDENNITANFEGTAFTSAFTLDAAEITTPAQAFTGTEATLDSELSVQAVDFTQGGFSGNQTTFTSEFTGTEATLSTTFTGTATGNLATTITTGTGSTTGTFTGTEVNLNNGSTTITQSNLNDAFKSESLADHLSCETSNALTGAIYDGTTETLTFDASAFATQVKDVSAYTPSVKADVTGTTTGKVTAAGSVTNISYNTVDKVMVNSFTPAGSVANITYTPAGTNAEITYTPTGSLTGTQALTADMAQIKYTPAGSVATATFRPTGTTTVAFTPAGTVTGTVTPTGAVTVSANVTLPEHTHSAAFAGADAVIEGKPTL